MAATKAFTGKGTVLSIGSGGTSETFTPIVQVKTFALSGQKWSFEDITNAGSPASGIGLLQESLPTLVNPGELAIDGIFLPSDPGQLALATAFAAGTLTDFKLQLPMAPGQTTTGNLYAFSAYVQDMPVPSIDYSKAMTFKVTLKLNTAITVTVGS